MDVEQPRLGRNLNESTGGFDMVLPGVLFALAGLWLDRKVGTIPLFTIVLTIVGFVGAVANVYYRYKRQIEQIEAETAALKEARFRGADS